MSDEEKLLDLIRKLDPVKDEPKEPVKETTSLQVPNVQASGTPDPTVAAQQAVTNPTSQEIMQQAATATGTQAGGNAAQGRYEQNAVQVNPQLNRDLVKRSNWENVNNRSYNDTLALSRLADAFNAQRSWFAPSVNPLSRGGEGGGVQINAIQNPQVSTQEQRAMDMNRNLYTQRSQQDIARQGRSRDIPITLEEAIAQGILDKGQQYDMMNMGFSDQLRKDIWNRMFNDEYSNDIRERFAQYAADLQQQETAENANRLYSIFAKDPTLAVITAQQYGTQMPSVGTWLNNRFVMTQLNNMGISPNSAEAYQAYKAAQYMLAMEDMKYSASAMAGSIPYAIAGLQNGIPNNGAWQ